MRGEAFRDTNQSEKITFDSILVKKKVRIKA